MAARFWVGGTGTWDNSDTTHWASSSNGAGGVAVPTSSDAVTFDASSGGGTVTVAATINASNTVQSITMGAFTGTLDFSINNPSITLTINFNITGTGVRALKLGSGTYTLSGANGNVLDCTTSTNFTLTPGTATILVNGAQNNTRGVVLGTSLSWPTITISDTGSSGWYTDIGGTTAATIANLNLTASVRARFASSANFTISNAFTWAGSAYNSAILIQSSPGNTPTITAASGSTLVWAALAGITFAGNAVNATNSFDLKGNNMNGGSITGPSGGVAVGVIGS